MRAYVKEFFRTLTGSLSRFLSIVAIVALGVFFFVGIRATSPDMIETVSQYIVENNIYDIHIFAPYGFTEDDVNAIKATEGVKQVDATYSVDMICEQKEDNLIVTMRELPTASQMNQVKVIEGRLAESDDECVVDSVFLEKYGYKVGDTITVKAGEDQDNYLKINTFKIVGSVTSPIYLSLLDRGASTLGTGKVNGFVMINKDVFDKEVYTDIYVSATNTAGASALYKEYGDSLKPLETTLKNIGLNRASIRGNAVKNEALSKLADAKKKVQDAQDKLADAKKQLDDAKVKIESGENDLQAGTDTYNSQIADAQKKLDDAKKQLDDAKSQIDENEAQLNASQSSIDTSRAQIEAGLAEVAKNRTDLEAQKPFLTAEQYNEAVAKLDATEASLNSSLDTLNQNQAKVTAGFAQLAQAKEDYNNGLAQLSASQATFNEEKLAGQKKLDDAKAKLEKAKKDYAKGESEYNSQYATAQVDITKANEDIADGQKKIDDLIEAKWYVTGVDLNAGVQSYINDTDRLSSIGDVFPALFFLVAALVCLTVMTRMVEEDRTKIGTLKALGYSKGAIALKYIVYAVLASVIGSIIGAIAGFELLPKVIAKAYSTLYQSPGTLTPIRSDLQFEAMGFSVLATTVPALLVCLKQLNRMPATLMRPKSPKAGKRILLEYIPFIWRKLSFTRKVTLRNLFRYKSRFIMTLLGIAGCTMLLVTGLGLNDSISGIVDKTFNEIETFDCAVTLPSSNNLNDVLNSDSRISSYIYADREYINVKRDQTQEDNVQLVVPKQDISPYISIHTVSDHKTIPLPDEGVVITQKLSELLDINVGDSITLINQDNDKTALVTVKGICENYLGHYIYMSENSYKAAFAVDAQTNAAVIKVNDAPNNEKALAAHLLSEGALNVTLNSEQKGSFNDTISNVIYVIFVLIASAAALAFVVLFSLTSINIEERVRELATIKVLGFYDREVSSYVYRENVILTVLGALLGVVFGYFMHGYILTTMEKDILKFTRYISIESYVLSIVITIGFGIIVNLIMNRRLKKINMVESLKSNE